jgi:hypothetical protein
MYKDNVCFEFKRESRWLQSYYMDFETESELNSWMADRLAEGLIYIGEKEKIVEVYPQVLRLDLKSPGNSYYKVIERFESSEDYLRYCDYKLLEGFKVIGSEPYFKEIENA